MPTPDNNTNNTAATSPGEAFFSGDTLVVSGNWVLAHYKHLQQTVNKLTGTHRPMQQVDISDLGHVDTAGAAQLAELLGPQALLELTEGASQLPDEQKALIRAVGAALAERREPPEPKVSMLRQLLGQTGQQVESLSQLVWLLLGFVGQTLAVIAWVLPRPRHWRMTSFVASIQDTGLNALPIVALLTFLVGAVVAFLGATVLDDFGATIYTVNLVAFSFLREFGVLLAAILLAGRTASSFTAHIGAMKVNEELDAIRTLGLNPIELLVIPRVLAMMVSLPILTFVGMMSGMVGGAMVCALVLDISPAQFVAILERDIAVRHFLVGLGKAPVFAFVIAVIGCLEGFKVSGSAQSVGEHTTSSVVQSIFMVILLDSIAALFFMEMGW